MEDGAVGAFRLGHGAGPVDLPLPPGGEVDADALGVDLHRGHPAPITRRAVAVRVPMVAMPGIRGHRRQTAVQQPQPGGVAHPGRSEQRRCPGSPEDRAHQATGRQGAGEGRHGEGGVDRRSDDGHHPDTELEAETGAVDPPR